jgi:hypothetical protein
VVGAAAAARPRGVTAGRAAPAAVASAAMPGTTTIAAPSAIAVACIIAIAT